MTNLSAILPAATSKTTKSPDPALCLTPLLQAYNGCGQTCSAIISHFAPIFVPKRLEFDLRLWLYTGEMGFLIQILFGIVCVTGAMAQLAPNSNTANVYDGNSNSVIHPINSYVLDDKHLLERGDEVSFQIVEDKKPATNLVVADSSELSIPYIGRVSVGGRTCRQLAAELKKLLEKDYYYRATVVIGLNSVNKVRGQVLVWGEVRNQGPVDILSSHNLTLGEAILRSGGLTDDADKKKVKVVRRQGHNVEQVFEVNLADVMEKGKTDKDVILEPGDYIIVRARSIKF